MSFRITTRWGSKAVLLATLALHAGAGLASLQAAASGPAALEYQVKAGYLFNFAKFIEWPASALPAPDSPFVIGVLDEGEALPVLQSLLTGKTVGSHPLTIKTVSATGFASDIQILLVTRAARITPEELQSALAGVHVLLVGETDQFAERGGMIGFVRVDEAIRLTLNLDRVTAAGLKVSAKLSSVARVVKTRSGP